MRHPEKNVETVAACPRLLTKAEVLALLGVTYTTVFTWMREGQFPLSIELGPSGGRSTKIAWLADEVYAWIASRPRRKLTPTPIKPSTQSARGAFRRSVLDAWMSAHDHSPENRARSNSLQPPAGHL